MASSSQDSQRVDQRCCCASKHPDVVAVVEAHKAGKAARREMGKDRDGAEDRLRRRRACRKK